MTRAKTIQLHALGALSILFIGLAAVAAYSLITTLWRQLAYGGDALGPAWWRMGLQLSVLLLALALRFLVDRARKRKTADPKVAVSA